MFGKEYKYRLRGYFSYSISDPSSDFCTETHDMVFFFQYACRKALADSQPRIRGRFARTEESDNSRRQ